MKNLRILFIVSILLILTKYSVSQVFEPVWSDEFNYNGLPDSTKWDYDIGGHGWGNNELQYYTANRLKNARIENGNLVIEAHKEPFERMGYTSTRLVTRGKFDFLYGKVEVRAKLPWGKGTWPAIWTLPTDWVYGPWPRSGELDIMEHVGFNMNQIHLSCHTLDYYWKRGTQKTGIGKIETVDKLFHTYTMEWTPEFIKGYIDEKLYFTMPNEKTGWTGWPFDRRHYLILNIAVGGSWGAAQGVDSTIYPQRMEVDFVKVYKYKAPADKAVPSNPTRLLTTSSDSRITLIWNPSVDNYSVKEYEIFMNDKPVGTTIFHSFEVKGLAPLREYTFKVRAKDHSGNVSGYLSGKFSTTDVYYYSLPAKIEAEDYVGQLGILLQPTADDEGFLNAVWLEKGKWLEFLIEVPETDNYFFEYRVATELADCQIELLDEKGNVMAKTKFSNTKGWLIWSSVRSDGIKLEKGKSKIRLLATADKFNLNWFKVLKEVNR